MGDETPYDVLRRRTYSTPYLGERIAKGLETATLRDLSVTFADIQNYTGRSVSWPADRIVSYVEDFYGLVTATSRSTDGYVDKFMGDGVMVIHGLRLREGQDVSRHPALAVEFGLKLLEAARAYNENRAEPERMHVRVGAACGDIVAGAFRNEDRMIFTAIGVCVNLAARLEKEAPPDSILVSEGLKERLDRDFKLSHRFVACSRFELKGFDRPIVACRLTTP